MIAWENSGHNVVYDYAEVSRIVEAGAASTPITDCELTSYACYLIVQNGDPGKGTQPIIKGRYKDEKKQKI